MKKKKSLYIVLAILILAISLLAVPALADAGSFSGSSDYGSGGGWSGSSGSSGWGGSSGGSFVFIGDGGGSGGGFSVIVVIVILVVLFAVFKARKSATSGGGSVNVPPPVNTSLLPLSTLSAADQNFSEAAIRDKVSNLYVRMQDAWQNKDFDPMRPYMTDALFNQFARQLDELVKSGCTNFVDRIAVLGVTVDGWTQDATNDSLVITLNTRITDYTVDDSTGKVVGGSKTAEKFMCYQWTLIRSKGMTTPEPGGGTDTLRISCPSCGAPLDINQSAKCEYCGTIVNARDYDWVISNIRGISQRTA